MNLFQFILISATLMTPMSMETGDRPWEDEYFCLDAGEAINIIGMLCSIEKGECRVLSDNNRLYQLRQYTEYSYDSKNSLVVKTRQRDAVARLGAEDLSEVLPKKLARLIETCSGKDIATQIYAFHYPHDLLLVVVKADNNHKRRELNKFVKLCHPQTHAIDSILHANRIPIFKGWFEVQPNESTEEVADVTDSRINQTYRLFTKANSTEYIFYANGTYEGYFSDRKISFGRVRQVEYCKTTWPPPIVQSGTRTPQPRREEPGNDTRSSETPNATSPRPPSRSDPKLKSSASCLLTMVFFLFLIH